MASNDIAIVSQDEELTYAELVSLADEVAEGVPSRSLVFLIAENSIPAMAGYIGLFRSRSVPVMLRSEISESQLAGLVEAYMPQFWWAPEGFAQRMAGIIGDVRELFSDRGYVLLSTGSEPCEMDEELGLLLTTSGSTGTPKFVRLTYANVEANARSIAEYQQITPSDRAITTLPFTYSYGISIVNSHLISGASLAVTEEGIMSRSFWDFLKKSEATNFGGVPYTYSMLEKLRFGRMELPSLRFISQAGGRLGARLQEVFGRACEDKGIEFFVMYGQTEATARMSWLPPKYVLEKLGSIGIAIPKGEFSLIDVDGEVIDAPEVAGELVYRGPNVSLGYAECLSDLAKGDENHGVLHTGDMAKRDEDGFYYIVGRMKRFLKMFGNRVNLDEVQEMLADAGFESACVGEDDHMVVFTTSEALDDMKELLASETKIHHSAFEVRNIDEIPHTSSGKVEYAALESLC